MVIEELTLGWARSEQLNAWYAFFSNEISHISIPYVSIPEVALNSIYVKIG
jgi:hypothetical protein